MADNVAIASMIIALITLVVGLIGSALFLTLWMKVVRLERYVLELRGESPPEKTVSRRLNPISKRHKAQKTAADVNRISGYESAPESVILDEHVLVQNRNRSASVHGKSKFLCQVYRTAQSFFEDDETETESSAPSVEDITIQTYPAWGDPARDSNLALSRQLSYISQSHSRKKPETGDCRRQMFVHKTIDSKGGQLEISGVKLTIPAGAISQATDMSLGLSWSECKRPNVNASTAILSPLIMCQPHDIVFKKSIQLSFPHCAVNTLSDWTIRLMKNIHDVTETPMWNQLTLEDYEERDITDTSISIVLSHLYSMYCCTGQSKGDIVATKSMSLLAFTSTNPEDNQVRVKTYCVNDYSKYASSTTENVVMPDMSDEDGNQRIELRGDSSDLVVHISQLSQPFSLPATTIQTLSFVDLWHDNASSCAYVLEHGEDANIISCDLNVHQATSDKLHTLTIRQPLATVHNQVE